MRTLPEGLTIRRLASSDSYEALTQLLHRAYHPLAAAGVNFTAASQDAETTRRRCERGETWVGIINSRIVSTVTLTFPYPNPLTPWYGRSEVAVLNQLAVEPGLQGAGIGSAMIAKCEARARELGAGEVALDTSETVPRLVNYYTRRGYRFVEYAQWPGKTYRSVILSKRLESEKD